MNTIKARLNTRSMEELVDLATQLAKNNNDLLWELISARKKAGFTQAELAEIMDVTQPTVAAFEREDNDPRLSTLARYALAVGANINHHVAAPYISEGSSNGWRAMSVQADLGYTTPPSRGPQEQQRYAPHLQVTVAA